MPDGEREVTAESAFADALRDAVRRKGLGLGPIHDRLRERGAPISPATLSYWQTGRSRPERADSLLALDQLEGILDVDAGSLRRLLPAPRRRGRSEQVVPRSAIFLQGDRVAAALDELGVVDGTLSPRSIHDLYVLDAQGREREKQTRIVCRAEVAGARYLPAVYCTDAPAEEPPQISAVRGCTLDGVVTEAAIGLVVGRLVLDRDLARGDTALAEFHVGIPQGPRSDRIEGAVTRRVGEIVLGVSFDRGGLPARCEGYTLVDGEEKAWDVVVNEGTAQILLVDFGPGRWGLRWQW